MFWSFFIILFICLDFYALVQLNTLECLSVVEMISPMYEQFQPVLAKM